MPLPTVTLSVLSATAFALLMVLVKAAPVPSTIEEPPEDHPTPEAHHASIPLGHFRRHNHYHHYRNPSKHWMAGLLLVAVLLVLGWCVAAGLWRRYCAHLSSALAPNGPEGVDACADDDCSPPFRRRRGSLGAPLLQAPPLLQPPPLPLLQQQHKESPPPYKESWT